MTDHQPAYRYRFETFVLHAAEVTNRYLVPVFGFGGVVRDARSVHSIDFEMPTVVSSFEQAVAWISYGIGEKTSVGMQPNWLIDGFRWKSHLPWVQRLQAYEARPHCLVERDWFRLAAKRLRTLTVTATPGQKASFTFDGEVLKIAVCNNCIPLPARGIAWDKAYAVDVDGLSHLLKRFSRPVIEVAVWEGQFSIGSRACSLSVSDPNSTVPLPSEHGDAPA